MCDFTISVKTVAFASLINGIWLGVGCFFVFVWEDKSQDALRNHTESHQQFYNPGNNYSSHELRLMNIPIPDVSISIPVVNLGLGSIPIPSLNLTRKRGDENSDDYGLDGPEPRPRRSLKGNGVIRPTSIPDPSRIIFRDNDDDHNNDEPVVVGNSRDNWSAFRDQINFGDGSGTANTTNESTTTTESTSTATTTVTTNIPTSTATPKVETTEMNRDPKSPSLEKGSLESVKLNGRVREEWVGFQPTLFSMTGLGAGCGVLMVILSAVILCASDKGCKAYSKFWVGSHILLELIIIATIVVVATSCPSAHHQLLTQEEKTTTMPPEEQSTDPFLIDVRSGMPKSSSSDTTSHMEKHQELLGNLEFTCTLFYIVAGTGAGVTAAVIGITLLLLTCCIDADIYGSKKERDRLLKEQALINQRFG